MTVETKKAATAAIRTCVLYLDFLDLLDDHLAALVASRIYWWCCVPGKNGKSKLRVYKGGQWWLAKSRADWEAELNMSPKQVSRVMDLLERHQLVQTMVTMFNGKPTTHIRYIGQIDPENRLSDKQPVIVLDIPKVPIGINESASGHKRKCLKDVSITCNTTGSTNMNSIKRVASSTPVTASEVLKNFSQGKTDKKVGGVLAMKVRWKKLQPEHLGFQKELTAKEIGQLKHVHKALGETALAVMEWALSNWQGFTSEVQGMKGVSILPSVPVVGFFCQHYDVAVNLMAVGQKPQVVQSIAQKPVVVVEKVQEVVHTPQQSDYLDVMAQLEKITGKP